MHDDGGGGLGGLFGGVAIGTAFKARKGKLDACSPKAKTEARVTWTGSGGKVTNVAATAADPKVAKCVERALAGRTVDRQRRLRRHGSRRKALISSSPPARWLIT